MLVCALLVWSMFPSETIYTKNLKRSTYLTEIDCNNALKNRITDEHIICIQIDKRIDFSLEEWNEDNCGRSEHKWVGR